ncbi:hypothetical protein L596_017606 [Steinernema carpocapsae]|uniref:Exoribonuclease phosphorolytic domain-containing protein n=1 Tax=Steinernema carpocapsae TaxID=34508 RepID=A0A4U5N270_STECR|nr:hypothetical protein L596_017606 [Steinernema carpocapsae]
MHASLHECTRSDGSCLLHHGNSSYLAAVSGPRACRMNKRDFAKVKIDTSFRLKELHVFDRKVNYLLRNVIQQAVTKKPFPRQLISCNVQEIEGNNASVATAINAMCLALLDATVPLHFMFCGVHISVGSEKKQPKVEPECSFLFVFKNSLFTGGELIGSTNRGTFTMAAYEQALEKAKESALEIFDFYRQVLDKNLGNILAYGSRV